MRCTRRGVALAAGPLLVAGMLAAGPAAGQEGVDPAGGAGISDKAMQAFVRAAQAVRRLREDAEAPVSAKLRRRMAAAVKAEGLTVDQYNRIARRVRSDEGVYERYQQAWTRLRAE